VLYDRVFLGTAFVGLGPSNVMPVLEGSFSAWLVPGASPFNGSDVDVSISQSGFIPSSARWLFFKGGVSALHPDLDIFGVFIGNQRLSVSADPISGEFTADVSEFAGRVETLRFTSFNLGPLGPSSFVVDSIGFSSVPEPGTISLTGLSLILFGACFWRKKARDR